MGAPKGRRIDKYQCYSCKLRYPDSEFYRRSNGSIIAECKSCARDRQTLIALSKAAKKRGKDWLGHRIVVLEQLLRKAKQLRDEQKD